MRTELSEVMMNPVRQRVIQYLMIHEKGTVENVYRLNTDLFSSLETEDNGLLVQTTLFSLCKSFADYFAGKDADPVRDMLAVNSSTLMLTDEEFMDFLMKMQELMLNCLSKEPVVGSKPRQITLISSPGGKT